MKQEKILPILIRVGLNSLESACYLALLKQSPQKASELSRRVDVPRGNYLQALYRMSDEMGIITRTKKEKCLPLLGRRRQRAN